MDYKTFHSIQILALESTEIPNYENFRERVARWYSQKFNERLTDARGMADEELLKAYFEEMYYDLATGGEEEQKRYQEIREKLLTEEKTSEDQVEEDDWVQKELESLKKQEEKLRQSSQPQSPNLQDSGFVSGEAEIPED